MSLFSFGGSKNKSTSSANSQDVGFNTSTSFSDSLSVALSGSQGTSSSRLAFEDVFNNMYGNATGAASRAAELTPLLQGEAASLFSSGNQFLQQLGGGAGADYLESRITGENPLVDQQIGSLGDDLGRFFREELNPEITSQGVAGGTLGGGRQGVAQGMAIDRVAREFQKGALGFRTADMEARDSAARDLTALENQGAGMGLQNLNSMFDLRQSGALAELSPYQGLSSILGGPTVMQDSQSSSFSESESVARALSEALGFSYGTSESESKGKGKSVSMGF